MIEALAGKLADGYKYSRHRRDFLALINEVETAVPARELHLMLENLTTHEPKHGRGVARHKSTRPQFAPRWPVGWVKSNADSVF